MLGEVCHFIDTCSALAGAPVTSAHAMTGPGYEPLLAPDVVVNLSFADGSIASISYASGGHSGTAKERIEVLGRGHTVVVDDFRSVSSDGKEVWSGAQDKGHEAQLTAFREAVKGGISGHATGDAIATTAAALAAAGSLLSGGSVAPNAADG